MLLREFLYVDVDKVRGLQAQLDGGISEQEQATTHEDKQSEIGLKGLAQHYQQWGVQTSVQKSLGDALFPLLEEALEAHGLLHDLSESLSKKAFWTDERLHAEAPPGTLVRITADGFLFDARYVSATLAAFTTVVLGLGQLDVLSPAPAAPGRPQRGAAPKGSKPRRDLPSSGDRQLEDAVPDVPSAVAARLGVSTEQLRGIIQVSRGVFTPGLHMNLFPTDDSRYAVSTRLQEGRQFLDGEPDVLFARYGVGPQQWTVVGTVGHYSDAASANEPVMPDYLDGDGRVRRAALAGGVNSFLAYFGALGFVDLPQPPGFSLVPLAVYRVINSSRIADGP